MQYIIKIINLPRSIKILTLITSDIFLILLALWSSFSFRIGKIYNPYSPELGLGKNSYTISNYLNFFQEVNNAVWIFFFAPVIAVSIFYYLGLYKSLSRFNYGQNVIALMSKGVLLYSLILGSLIFIFEVNTIPRLVILLNIFFSLFLLVLYRYLLSFFLDYLINYSIKKSKKINLLIFGAGEAGRKLAKIILTNNTYNFYGFIDDNKNIHNLKIMGSPIISPSSLDTYVIKHQIKEIFIATPAASANARAQILKKLKKIKVRIRTLPPLHELLEKDFTLNSLEDLDIDDILGRPFIKEYSKNIEREISNKIILVTGAGGSIGEELCNQILAYRPKALLLLERNEFSLYKIQNLLNDKIKKIEMNQVYQNYNIRLVTKIVPLLCSITDIERIDKIITTWQPDIIYHAAAYKHVPMVEFNITEAIYNNVFGTFNLALMSIKYDVSKFVLISTDKAVRPTNIMGATKRVSELILQAMNSSLNININHSGDKYNKNYINSTIFTIVRFGNVLGSSGSVVPLFREQIKQGGPITLTDEKITRYFMSISEASDLVIRAGQLSKSNDKFNVYVLNMGEPVKIINLAKDMVEKSGLTIKDSFNPNGDIKINVIGLRPGEKIYEELLIGNKPIKTSNSKIIKAQENFFKWNELETHLFELKKFIQEEDIESIYKTFTYLVSGFSYSKKINDSIYNHTNKNNS